MGQSFGQIVKSVAPEWLIEELKRDVQLAKRTFTIARDVALIDYNSFKDIVADMNAIMKTCCIEVNEQILFGIRTVDDDVFWKAYVKIICIKVDKQEKTLSVMRCMNIHQFWLLREGILRELQKKKAMTEKQDEFVFVDYDGNNANEGPSSSSPVEEKELDVTHRLTISTVLDRVDEFGDVDTDECLICLDNKIDVSLPCAHSFCSQCISQWSNTNNSCPTCRGEINAPEELWQFTDIPNITQINRQLLDLATGT